MAPPSNPAAGDARFDMMFAVHTRTCTYLLDDDGVCRWVVSKRGAVPPHIRTCIGAQFVACLDLQVDGGLLGELRVGAMGLFVQHTGTHMVLLRTGPILKVDDRRVPQEAHGADAPQEAADETLTQQRYQAPPLRAPLPPPPLPLFEGHGESRPAGRGNTDTRSLPHFGIVRDAGEEVTVTITLPLPMPPKGGWPRP